NLISESLVGRAVASKRQNAGSVSGVVAEGGEKGPAAIAIADLIVMFGMVSAARLSHEVPPGTAGATAWPINGSSATARAAERRTVMGASRDCGDYTVRTTLPITCRFAIIVNA